jgi:glycosyltransferase involved in cell wall biosynthesis
VLHVLPHPGGGGEKYVDVLNEMDGYRFTRTYLAPIRKPPAWHVVRGLVDVSRRFRRHDIVHVHGEGASALCLPHLALRPSVVTLHGLHLLRRLDDARRHAAALNLKAVVRTADRTICVSGSEYEELHAVVGGIAAQRAVVIHNGARLVDAPNDAAREEVRSELDIAASETVGIWVGALDERRDPMTVVRAAERTPVAFLVVGDGPLRAEVERAANSFTRILGHREDVPRLLNAADFFVIASRREGLSFALLEAMAHGLPAVVSDVAENVEAVNGVGIFVENDDENGYVAAFRRLLENVDERKALGNAARRRAKELFDANDMITKTRATYDEVLAERAS